MAQDHGLKWRGQFVVDHRMEAGDLLVHVMRIDGRLLDQRVQLPRA